MVLYGKIPYKLDDDWGVPPFMEPPWDVLYPSTTTGGTPRSHIGLWPPGDGFLATVPRSRRPRIGEAAGESAAKEVLQRNKARQVVDRQVVLACGA